MNKRKAHPQFSPGGVPRPGSAYPSPHEQAVLRRLARPGASLLVTQRAGKPPTYAYGDTGEVILAATRDALDEAGFKRLSAWLEPNRSSSFFGAPAQIWRARKPSSS